MILSSLYFSYIDDEGHAQKPFLLPQKDPAFYDDFLNFYGLPEFMVEPVSVSENDLVNAIHYRSTKQLSSPLTAATPKSAKEGNYRYP